MLDGGLSSPPTGQRLGSGLAAGRGRRPLAAQISQGPRGQGLIMKVGSTVMAASVLEERSGQSPSAQAQRHLDLEGGRILASPAAGPGPDVGPDFWQGHDGSEEEHYAAEALQERDGHRMAGHDSRHRFLQRLFQRGAPLQGVKSGSRHCPFGSGVLMPCPYLAGNFRGRSPGPVIWPPGAVRFDIVRDVVP